MPTQDLPLVGGAVTFEGAVSLEVSRGGVKPWRLHHELLELYEPALRPRAESPSGVRITFLSDTRSVELEAEATPYWGDDWTWDLLVDGRLHHRVKQPITQGRVEFLSLPETRGELRRVELYMPSQYNGVRVKRLSIDAGARAERWADTRARWVVYGSSITHAREAHGPSETWPALIARRYDLHLTNLGYGGQEHLEPMVAEMIRDLPADLISLCVGGNVWGGASLTERTYRAAVIGMVRVIRERHPRTPMAVASFISTVHDGQPNPVGITIEQYRRWTRDAVEALARQGDAHLWYFDGVDLFGPHLRAHMPDGVHPDGEGNHVLARNYAQLVMPRLIPPATHAASAGPL